MGEYKYILSANNRKSLNFCLSVLLFGEVDEDIDLEGYGKVKFSEQDSKNVVEIEFPNDWSFGDFPNLYEDVECFYNKCKIMVEEAGACPFEFSFYISHRSKYREENYLHSGTCVFDGKDIRYSDHACLMRAKCSDSGAKAEYVNGEFVNEEKDFNTEIPD